MRPFLTKLHPARTRLTRPLTLGGSLCMLVGALLIGLPLALPFMTASPAHAQVTVRQSLDQASADVDGLSLFEAMMPAFSNPRCLNCHGGVNVVTGENHGGGAVPGAAALFSGDGRMTGNNRKCLGCHVDGVIVPPAQASQDAGLGDQGDPADSEEVNGLFGPVPPGAVGPWRLAPSSMSFVGKDARALCTQMRNAFLSADPSSAPGGGGSLDNHLQTEAQVGLAFQGGAGGISDVEHAPPPPITLDEMVAAAQRWETEGQMSCDRPGAGAGTISFISDSKSDNGGDRVTHFDNGSSRTNSEHDTRRTQVNVTIKDGVATADVSLSIRQDIGIDVADKCSVHTLTSEVEQYQGSGTPTVEITLQDDGTYSIYVAAPEIPGTRTNTRKTSFSGACDDTAEAMKLGNTSSSEAATVRPETFEIEGSMSTPNGSTLSGDSTETHGPTTITQSWNVAARNQGYSPDP